MKRYVTPTRCIYAPWWPRKVVKSPVVMWETTSHCYAVFGITTHRGSNLGIFDAGVVKFPRSTTCQWLDPSDMWRCHKTPCLFVSKDKRWWMPQRVGGGCHNLYKSLRWLPQALKKRASTVKHILWWWVYSWGAQSQSAAFKKLKPIATSSNVLLDEMPVYMT